MSRARKDREIPSHQQIICCVEYMHKTKLRGLLEKFMRHIERQPLDDETLKELDAERLQCLDDEILMAGAVADALRTMVNIQQDYKRVRILRAMEAKPRTKETRKAIKEFKEDLSGTFYNLSTLKPREPETGIDFSNFRYQLLRLFTAHHDFFDNNQIRVVEKVNRMLHILGQPGIPHYTGDEERDELLYNEAVELGDAVEHGFPRGFRMPIQTM
jgi:hypothetical protein